MKSNENKQNVLIMGRKTYFGIPEAKRPLKGRINIVLTSQPEKYQFPEAVLTFTSLEKVYNYLEKPQIRETIENIWVIGGSVLYAEAMLSERCNRIYYTDIFSDFECDTFFPNIPSQFVEVNTNDSVEQEENGIKYRYKIYGRK